MRPDIHARSVIAEILAVLRDQAGFEIFWTSLGARAQDDLTEELVEVVMREE